MLNNLFASCTYFGVAITLVTYFIGMRIKKRFPSPICNPMLISMILVGAFIVIFRVDYDVYYSTAKYISFLLTPATVCLAVPLYEKFELLKKNLAAVFIGIGTGVVASLLCVLALSVVFRLDHNSYVALLSKSITTAIGMDVTAELGGHVTLTIAAIIVTGILGNITAETAVRILHITDPIARGVAIGTASHAMGTSKALEIGEVEGAMSSLSIVVAGLLTVVGASVFANFL